MNGEDSAFKLVLKVLLGETLVVTEADVPSGNLRIDYLLVKQPWVSLPLGLPAMLDKRVVVGEFKSFRDVLKTFTITSLFAKGFLVLDTVLRRKKPIKADDEAKVLLDQAVNIKDYALLLILAGKNKLSSIQQHYQLEEKNLEQVSPGIYHLKTCSPLMMDFYLMSLEELPLNHETMALKLFASPYWREESLKHVINHGDDFIYTLCLYLFREEVVRVSQLLGKKRDPLKESIKKATEDLGIEKVVDAVGIEKVVDAVGIEKVVDAVGIEKVVDAVGIEAFLKKVMKQLSKGELKAKDKKIIQEFYNFLKQNME